MKNTIYGAVIAACLVVAVVVFVTTHGKHGRGLDGLSDAELIWVKCAKCGQSYQMGLKQYYKELEDKARANPTPMPIPRPLTCQKCNQDGVRKAFKCEKCGTVSFEGLAPGDFPDRCPKCKYSAIEANRRAAQEARQAGQ
jgi:hypothetical protein